MIKTKYHSIVLALCIVQTLSYGSTSVDCNITDEVFHQPIGDQSGKIILTSKKVYRECTKHITVKGQCLEWKEDIDEFKVNNFAQIAKINVLNNGNISEALSVLAAVNQSAHMFNGVKGRCIYGIQEDFSWLQDPMFYAGLLMDYLGSDQFQSSFVSDTTGPTGSMVKPDGTSYKIGEAGTKTATKANDFAQAYAKYGKYASCAIGAAADMAGAASDFYSDDYECDPVDEFCGGDNNGGVGDPGLVQTLTVAEYNTLIAKDPTMVNYIEVIDNGIQSGYVTFRIIDNSNATLNDSSTQEQIEKARQDAKLKQTQVKIAISSVKAAACFGSTAWNSSGNSSPDAAPDYGPDSTNDVQPDGYKPGDAAANAAPGLAITMLLPFPYNSLATIALKVFQSFQPIDSCMDENDATSQGQRHLMAYRGLRFNSCHEIIVPQVIGKSPLGSPMLNERKMCCFDAPMSKILMVQMHAQVGKGWAHCTGITLNELAHISWRQCSEIEMGSGMDGGSALGIEGVDYNMKDSYQYKYQCMNLNEFKAYVKSQIPVDYSDTQVSEMLQYMTNDLTEANK